MDWQNDIFEPGRTYGVKQSFRCLGHAFVVGERLVFRPAGYSRCDDGHGYAFYSLEDGQEKVWLMHHERPAGYWRRFFEPHHDDGLLACCAAAGM